MRRTLKLHDAVFLVVGNTLGVGLFVATGPVAAALATPQWTILAWVFGGFLALCGALVYAELGALMPQSGGDYVYLSRTFSPALGFLSGWVSLIAGFSAPIALTAHAFGGYLSSALPAGDPKLLGTMLIALLTFVHAARMPAGVRIQNALTLFKLVLLVGICIGVALSAPTLQAPVPAVQPLSYSAVGFALTIISFSYLGWNIAAYVAGQISRPARTLPAALVIGTAISMLVFVALNAVAVTAVPYPELATSGELAIFLLVEHTWGGTQSRYVAAAVAICLASSVSAMMMAGPRMYARMAEDGVFFAMFARRSRNGAPTRSIVLQSVLALLLLWTSSFTEILIYVGLTVTLSSALTVLGAVRLRISQPGLPRPFSMPLWPVVSAIFFLSTIWMIAGTLDQRPFVLATSVGTCLSGVLVYRLIVANRFRALSTAFRLYGPTGLCNEKVE